MKETMTYNDFLSEVEKNKELMIKDGLLSTPNQLMTLQIETNRKLKFEDLEVGKIYVFWKFKGYGDRIIEKTWFIKPTELKSPKDYSLYWCYYNIKGELNRNKIINPAHHSDWSGYVWAGKDWLILDSLYPMKQKVINWNNLPWSDLK